MDFGLDRLLEMLESRFGRKPTNAVLLLIIAAVVVVSLNLIWNQGIEPLRSALADASKGHIDWGNLAARFGLSVASGTVGVAIVLIGGRILTRRVIRHAENTVRVASEALKGFEERGDEILVALTKVRNEAIVLRREARRETKRAQEAQKKAQAIYEETQRVLREVEQKAPPPPDEAET